MSGPVSLRRCCLAAMAPALTETTGHSRLEFKGGLTPVRTKKSTDDTTGVTLKNVSTLGAIASDPIRSVKLNTASSSSGARQRGLLQPIHQENGATTNFALGSNSSTATKKLKSLEFVKTLPGILNQFSTVNGNTDYRSDQYPKFCEKKMNQPSNGNGPNGTGKKFIKQTILAEESKLNGHSKTDVSLSRKLTSVLPGQEFVKKRNLQCVDSFDRQKEMCHTSTTCANSGTGSSATLSNNVNGRDEKLQIDSKHEVEMLKKQVPCPGTADFINDASRKQFLLERRSQFLTRRLRRVQGKQLETQVYDQLKSFAEFQHQKLQAVASRAIRPFGDFQSTFFNSSDIKNLSTSNLVSLVRKLQSSQQKSAACSIKKTTSEGHVVFGMEQGMSAESDRKSSQMKTTVGHWNSAVDDDVTESSSGGESCEEWEDCPVMEDKKIPVPLYKRAEWKWAVDRAAIISRWTWLQAQVSDLEYRIRQQKEIYKTIRTSKGVVTLGNMSTPVRRYGDSSVTCEKKPESPANVTTLMININKQASKLTQSLGNCLSPVVSQGHISDKTKDASTSKSLNGYVDGSHSVSSPQAQGASRLHCGAPIPSVGPSGDSGHVTCSPDLNQPLDANCVSARCRPVRFYRKRKLLRTAGLHQTNHKAARLSTVKCQCFPPTEYCPLCGGRYNNVHKLDAEGMAVMEKVALLDQSYHPVLSFPQEIALPIHFEALLKSGEWQTVKPPTRGSLRALAAEKRRQKMLNAQLKDQARKNRKNFTKSAAAVLLTSAKLRSKYEGKSPHGSPKKKIAENRLRRKELKRRRAAQLAAAAQKKNGFGTYQDTDQDSLSTQTPSPGARDSILSLSGQSGSLKEAKELSSRKRRFENAYDINNIVIPYSMAAATRVEKLQYKEIQTPKWRELPVEQTGEEKKEVNNDCDPNEVEDISDEAFSARHQSMEEEERKRIRSFITYPPVRRSRQSRESESQSSDVTESLMTEYNIDQDGQPSLMHHSASAFYREEGRRRSGSTSRRMAGLDDYVMDYENNRMILEPWATRDFPLSEECYEDMKKEQISVKSTRRKSYTVARPVKVHDDDIEFVSPDRSESPAAPDSPSHSYSSGSTLDDLNDPEWHGERKKIRRPSGGIRSSRR